MTDAPTWIVLARDVSDSVVVSGQRRTTLAMVLEAETGRVVNVSPGTSIDGVLKRSLKSALVTPAPPVSKTVPARIVVPAELLQATQAAAAGLSWLAGTAIIEGAALDDAEEVMDALVGRMEGRWQPQDLPDAQDYRVLYGVLLDFVEASPWQRWTDGDWFAARLSVDGEQVDLDCLVLGNAGVQHGFNAVPDAEQMVAASSGIVEQRLTHLDGALMVHLDPWRETPSRFADKARRYGWPSGAGFVPTLVSIHDGQPADISRLEARLLALAIRGVLSQDRRRLVTADRPSVSGELTYADGAVGTYDVSRP